MHAHGTADMTLRHSWAAYAVAFGTVALGAMWLVEERSAQAAVVAAVAIVGLLATSRALIAVHRDTVYHRGLLRWNGTPLLLSQLTVVRLRREASGPRWPLVLTLETPDTGESIECWAWRGWRDLAHLAGHAADAVGARMDDSTRRRVACPLGRGCPTAAAVAGATPHGLPPADDSIRSWGEAVLAVVGIGVFGFLIGAVRAWLAAGDDDLGSPLENGLLIGAVFVVLGLIFVGWDLLRRSR